MRFLSRNVHTLSNKGIFLGDCIFTTEYVPVLICLFWMILCPIIPFVVLLRWDIFA